MMVFVLYAISKSSLIFLGIYQMIEGFEDKSGYAQCIIAYMDEEFSEPKVFIGKTDVFLEIFHFILINF